MAEPPVPPPIALPARLVAVLILVPLRLLWEGLQTTGRLLNRFVATPVGRFLGWVLEHLVLLPVWWVVTRILWPPLKWFGTYILAPIAEMVLRGLSWLGRRIKPFLRWLWHKLRPGLVFLSRVLVDAFTFAWRVTTAIGRPIGRALRWVGRGIRAVWRAVVVRPWRWVGDHILRPAGRWLRDRVFGPAGRWLRDRVFRPAAAFARSVAAAVGLPSGNRRPRGRHSRP